MGKALRPALAAGIYDVVQRVIAMAGRRVVGLGLFYSRCGILQTPSMQS